MKKDLWRDKAIPFSSNLLRVLFGLGETSGVKWGIKSFSLRKLFNSSNCNSKSKHPPDQYSRPVNKWIWYIAQIANGITLFVSVPQKIPAALR